MMKIEPMDDYTSDDVFDGVVMADEIARTEGHRTGFDEGFEHGKQKTYREGFMVGKRAGVFFYGYC